MKRICVMAVILALAGAVAAAFSAPTVRTSSIIYIRPDGSIEPSVAPISTTDNVSYVLNDNVFYESIVIERNNIVFDGAGYRILGAGTSNSTGISLHARSNVTICSVQVSNFTYGIWLSLCTNVTISGSNLSANMNDGITLRDFSSNNTIVANNMTANRDGVYFWNASNNTVVRNSIAASNASGIELFEAEDNVVAGNRVENCSRGVFMSICSNNFLYHNNFVNNTNQTVIYYCESTAWDSGSEGNYWSDYAGFDLNNDGIGEAFYEIGEDNTDRHPLMGAFYDFTVSSPSAPSNATCQIAIVSNSTISNLELVDMSSQGNEPLQQAQVRIVFNASGLEGDGGFCRVMFPREVMNGSYAVLVNGQNVNFTELEDSDETQTCLYFTYGHSTLEIMIIAEIQQPTMLILFTAIAVYVAVIRRRKRLIRSGVH